MFAGFYRFDQVIQGVKHKTGIANLRNHYDDIRTLICAAEREINPYAGHLVLKKMIVYRDSLSPNNLYNGHRIIKPADFISLNELETCNEGLCDGQYFETVSHIVMCNNGKPPRDKVKFVYWAYQSDKNGDPVTTMNHAEAVEEYIVLAFKRQKNFLGELGLQEVRDQEDRWERRCQESRGSDFFPSDNQLLEISRTNHAESVQLFNIIPGHDGCYEQRCMHFFEELDPSIVDPDPEVNTPPEISDNQTPLVPRYVFQYPDLIKDYSDNQLHPPGSAIIKSNVEDNIGSLYLSSNVPSFPWIIPFTNIQNLSFEMHKNILVDDYNYIRYPQVSNIQERVQGYIDDGYSMTKQGLDLIFKKEIHISAPMDTDIFIFFDQTSMLVSDAMIAKDALLEWFDTFKRSLDNYTGKLYIIPTTSEKWLSLGSFPINGMLQNSTFLISYEDFNIWNSLAILPDNINTLNWEKRSSAIVIAFVDESYPEYHSAKLTDGFSGPVAQPTLDYNKDFAVFLDNFNKQYDYFKGMLYPIIKDDIGQSASLVLQGIAAIEGKVLIQSEIDSYNTPINVDQLLVLNPYMGAQMNGFPKLIPLKDLGWKGVFDKTSDTPNVFTSETFQTELNSLINADVEILILTETLSGELITDPSTSFNFSVLEESEEALESLDHVFTFNAIEKPVDSSVIRSFQFNQISYTKNDIAILTDSYLQANGSEHKEYELIKGKEIQYIRTGRIGFVINTVTPDKYRIFNSMNIDITETTFDKVFDSVKNLEFYVSKEYYIPNTIYFKFVKN